MKVRATANGIIIPIYVHPSAREEKIDFDDIIEVHTTEPPTGNRANVAVIRMLSRAFSIPKDQISIIRGSKSRDKEVFIVGVRQERLERLVSDTNPDHHSPKNKKPA